MKKNRKKRFIIIAIIVVIVIVLGASMALNGSKGPGMLTVPMSPVERTALVDRISASGSFQAERYTVVSSQTIGIVKAVHVKPGDWVNKNDILVEVDERESREALANAEIVLEETRRNLSIELAKLRADIRQASLNVDQASRELVRAERLIEVDGISEEELRRAKENLESANFALGEAKDRLRLAQGLPSGRDPILDPAYDAESIQSAPSYRRALLSAESAQRALDGCIIRAEDAGSITQIGVAVGDRLTIETVVAKIEDLSSIIAEVNVDEVDVSKVSEGMEAEISADSILGSTFSGTVSRVWPIVRSDGSGRVCLVQIDVDLEDKMVLSGASCMARIKSVLREEALIIPASALIPGSEKPSVWVAVLSEEPAAETPDAANESAANDVQADADQELPDAEEAVPAAPATPAAYSVEKREIEIGASTVNRIEVLSGLEEGELVIVDMLPMISEGMSVYNGAI